MAKRKIKCDLNDFVVGYLKRFKYEKTLKSLDVLNQFKNDHTADSEKFIHYLEMIEAEKADLRNEDDLGFEINLGAYQQQAISKPTRLIGNSTKKEKSEKQIDIPKEFIKTIEKLGMRKKDAVMLYKSKIDWIAVYSENKIYCIEPRCKYFSQIDNEDLKNHMINVHKYGEYPCPYDDCDYVAFSKVCSKLNLQKNNDEFLEKFKFSYDCSYNAVRQGILAQMPKVELPIKFRISN